MKRQLAEGFHGCVVMKKSLLKKYDKKISVD